MNITVAQMDIKLGDKEKNLRKVLDIIRDCNSDLILFPELFTTGFDFVRLNELAEEIPSTTTETLTQECGDAIVGGSILEKKDGKFFNTFVLVDRGGVVGAYRKIHLFEEEKDYLSAGNNVEVVKTKFGYIALATCYDIRFPELFREFMERKADVVLVSAEFPHPREEHWDILLKARAIENQFFVVATNRVGRDTKHEYFGRSMIVDPWGRVLVQGDDEERILSTEIELSEVSKIRDSFPVLRDRERYSKEI
jgi:predicted amidohydrolase